MKVSEIEPYDKKRSKIYIDGEYAFMLYKGEIRKLGLSENEEISEEDREEIVGSILTKRAKLRAMNLLQKQSYTEYKLIRKLKDGFYPEECINAAIEYVKSYDYINDERYARDFIDYHMDNRSRRRIEADLAGRGIDKNVINLAISNCYENADPLIEINQAKDLLRKKKYDKVSCDNVQKSRLMAFLYRKGFSADVICKALSLDTNVD